MSFSDAGLAFASTIARRILPSSRPAAAVDGVLMPDQVAKIVLEAMEQERFMILSHPQVQDYEQRKVSNRDRWIGVASLNRENRTKSARFPLKFQRAAVALLPFA